MAGEFGQDSLWRLATKSRPAMPSAIASQGLAARSSSGTGPDPRLTCGLAARPEERRNDGQDRNDPRRHGRLDLRAVGHLVLSR